jgi:hypothetical protein
MNIVKNRQSNRTKTVDTDKRSSSERSNDFKFGAQDNVAKPKEEADEPVVAASGLYCIGDLPFLLFFECLAKSWTKIEFSEESVYKGGLKYPSVICLKDKGVIILTGGCDNYTGDASESVFKANINEIDNFRKIQSMKYRRYGH